MSNVSRKIKPAFLFNFQNALREFEKRFFNSVEFYTEHHTWASSRFARLYIRVILAVTILIIRIRGVDPEKDGYFLRIVFVLSKPHIVDFFYYRSNRKPFFPSSWLLPRERYTTSLFVLQCLTLPSFKIDHKRIESLLNNRELWPLLISKGVEYRFFSNNSVDLEEQFEFIYINIQTFISCLANDNFKGFEQFLRGYVAAPPIGFSASTKKVYEAYRHLEQVALLALNESLSPFRLMENRQKAKRTVRIGFAFVSLLSGIESKLLLETLDSLPEDYHVIMIGLNDEEYTPEFKSFLAEKNIELALMKKTDVKDVLDGIRMLDLDILFYCSPFWGHFLSRIGLVAAARAAPIQMAYIGDVITTGLPSCDYFVLPSTIDSIKIRQGFTEKIFIVPPNAIVSQFLLKPYGTRMPSRKTHGGIVYFSNAHMWKLNGDLLDVWVQILSQVGQSVIRLAPFTTSYHRSYLPVLQSLIARKCKQWGVSPKRFEIIHDSGAKLIQKQLAMADIYLDSFPYNGSISIYEALREGLPIVSLTGDSCAESLSKAVLMQFNLEEDALVTNTDAYIEKAIALGRDAVLRRETSSQVRRKISHVNSQLDKQESSLGFWNEVDKLLPHRILE